MHCDLLQTLVFAPMQCFLEYIKFFVLLGKTLVFLCDFYGFLIVLDNLCNLLIHACNHCRRHQFFCLTSLLFVLLIDLL